MTLFPSKDTFLVDVNFQGTLYKPAPPGWEGITCWEGKVRLQSSPRAKQNLGMENKDVTEMSHGGGHLPPPQESDAYLWLTTSPR